MAPVIEILRHGEAAPTAGGGDRHRGLTPEGRAAIEHLARRLVLDGWKPDRVLSSPYLRARETAEIVARAAGDGHGSLTLEELEPDRDPAEALEAILREGRGDRVLVVGHQPLLGRLISHLTGSERSLPPGAFVRIEFSGEPRRGLGRVALALSPHEGG